MAAREISVKTYVVRLSGEERRQLETLIGKGESPARRLLRARILLKADVSEAGEGGSDSRIIEALDTSPSMVYRVCGGRSSRVKPRGGGAFITTDLKQLPGIVSPSGVS